MAAQEQLCLRPSAFLYNKEVTVPQFSNSTDVAEMNLPFKAYFQRCPAQIFKSLCLQIMPHPFINLTSKDSKEEIRQGGERCSR